MTAAGSDGGGGVLRQVLDSSSLASVGYDKMSRTLEVEFVNGSVYQYFEVPAGVVGELLSAESAGRYFNAHIRPRYRYTRV
jgi:hypothetical protein